MFDVLAFVYDHYTDSHACPELPALHRRLNTLGFAPREVEVALLWLEDLKIAARHLPPHPSPQNPPEPDVVARRVLIKSEQMRLGTEGWGLLVFLASIGALTGEELELVLDRAMAAAGKTLQLDDLKLIVLMVYWGLAHEPDALLLDELCDHQTARLVH